MNRWCLVIFVLAWLMAVPPAASQAQTTEQELLSTAQQAFNDGFSDVAMRYLEDFVNNYPQSPKLNSAKVLLGQCYFLRGQYTKALALFDELSGDRQDQDAVRFWRGETYLKQGHYLQAQADDQAVIKFFPDSLYVPQAYYSLGWSFFEQKQFDEAKEVFSRLVKNFPQSQLSEDALLKIAECDYNAGHLKEAAQSFRAYDNRFPKSKHACEVHFNLAESLYYLGRYESALPYYHKALNASCDDKLKSSAYVGEVWTNIQLKRFNEAQSVFKYANEFVTSKRLSAPDLSLAHANLAYEQGSYEQALKLFSDFIQKYPQNPHWRQGYLGRANVYYLSGRYQQAAADYRHLLEDSNADTFEKAEFGLGWSELKLGHLSEAVSHFQVVFDKSTAVSGKVNALIQTADAYQESGNLDEALSTYNQVVKNYPNNAMADYVFYRQAIAFLKSGKIDAALLGFKNLQANFPNSQYLQDIDYYIGVIDFKKGDWEHAVSTMDGFLKGLTRPSAFTPDANYILALSYLNLKQPDDARRIFEKILRLYPNDTEVAKNADIGIAKCDFELGQEKEAVRRFKLIVYKYPKTDVDFEALLWLAQYYLKGGDSASAIQFYQAMIDGFPGSAQLDQVHYELGQAYELQGQPDQALEQYKKISGRDQVLIGKARLAMAGILAKDMDPQRAIAAYESIIAADPEYAGEAYLKLGQLYRDQQDYEKEIETYQKALSVQEGRVDHAQLQFNLADTLELMSHTEEAIEQYLKIPRLYPNEKTWVVKAYLRVAKIYEEGKDWDGARVTYQKIIQLNTEEAKYAQERLEWIKDNAWRKSNS